MTYYTHTYRFQDSISNRMYTSNTDNAAEEKDTVDFEEAEVS